MMDPLKYIKIAEYGSKRLLYFVLIQSLTVMTIIILSFINNYDKLGILRQIFLGISIIIIVNFVFYLFWRIFLALSKFR
jgi:uncharacterized membrane protein